MQAVHGMGVEERIEQSGTTDIADDGNLMSGQMHILKCLIQRVCDALVSTTRTKNGRSLRI